MFITEEEEEEEKPQKRNNVKIWGFHCFLLNNLQRRFQIPFWQRKNPKPLFSLRRSHETEHPVSISAAHFLLPLKAQGDSYHSYGTSRL